MPCSHLLVGMANRRLPPISGSFTFVFSQWHLTLEYITSSHWLKVMKKCPILMEPSVGYAYQFMWAWLKKISMAPPTMHMLLSVLILRIQGSLNVGRVGALLVVCRMDANMVDFILYQCEISWSTSQCTLGSSMPMEPTLGHMRGKLGHRLLPGGKWHMKIDGILHQKNKGWNQAYFLQIPHCTWKWTTLLMVFSVTYTKFCEGPKLDA